MWVALNRGDFTCYYRWGAQKTIFPLNLPRAKMFFSILPITRRKNSPCCQSPRFFSISPSSTLRLLLYRHRSSNSFFVDLCENRKWAESRHRVLLGERGFPWGRPHVTPNTPDQQLSATTATCDSQFHRPSYSSISVLIYTYINYFYNNGPHTGDIKMSFLSYP